MRLMGPVISRFPKVGTTQKRWARARLLMRRAVSLPAVLLVGGALVGQRPSRTKQEQRRGATPVGRIPFVRAAYEHSEGAFMDVSQAVDDNVRTFQADVPAYGYLRGIWIMVSCTLGDLTAGTLDQDYPFSLLQRIRVVDVNSQAQFDLPGYEAMLANKWGGYSFADDPANDPDHVATVNANFRIWVPIEITAWDGFGSLANQNSAQPYRLEIVLNNRAGAFDVNPTTAPTVRIRAYLEAWSQPAPTDLLGNPQEISPPAHGTRQFWSEYTRDVDSGDQTIELIRRGNLIRTVMFVARTSAGVRNSAQFPNPLTFEWDSRGKYVRIPVEIIEAKMRRRYGYAPDAGVLVFDYSHDQDGHPGNENRHLYLPTAGASRLEVRGSWTGNDNELRVVTNDVLPVVAAPANMVAQG